MSDDTTKRRYHVFAWEDYGESGGMGDYRGSFNTLDEVLEAQPKQRDSIDPNLHVAYEQDGRLYQIDYVSLDEYPETGARIVRWGWQNLKDGTFELVKEQRQHWQPIDWQAQLRAMGLEGKSVTGGFASGKWVSDPL